MSFVLISGLPLTKSDVLVCGDLSKTDAYKYYLELLDSIVKANARHLFGRSEEDFEKIFHITGGRIYYIRRFVDQICSGRSIETGNFLSYRAKYYVLENELILHIFSHLKPVIFVFIQPLGSKVWPPASGSFQEIYVEMPRATRKKRLESFLKC